MTQTVIKNNDLSELMNTDSERSLWAGAVKMKTDPSTAAAAAAIMHYSSS